MPRPKTERPLLRGLIALARWAALGTAGAVAFGIALGLLIRAPWGALDVAFGGALVGVMGGPVFGIAIGLIRQARRSNGEGRGPEVRTAALTGAVVFGLLPVVVGLVRNGEIIAPYESLGDVVAGMLILAGPGAAFGALFALAAWGRPEKSTKSRPNGWSELEL